MPILLVFNKPLAVLLTLLYLGNREAATPSEALAEATKDLEEATSALDYFEKAWARELADKDWVCLPFSCSISLLQSC